MKECLWCKKDFQEKKETAKYCSTSCRVMYNRKNPKDSISRVSMKVMYDLALRALEELKNNKPAELPADFLNVTKIGIAGQNGIIEPLNFSKPQIALKSFEQWKGAKHECESEEQWEKIKDGINAAANLSQKQKDLLIKYS